MKVGKIIKEYNANVFAKFQNKKKFYESCENLKIFAEIKVL
jgi:hypothetical protein